MLVNELTQEIKNFLKKYGRVKLPWFTHTRKAMPSSISLWGNSFVDSMKDNLKTVNLALELIDQSPLGTGAGYGIPFKIDRNFTTKLLGFKNLKKNPIYAQNSRGKFDSTLLPALTQIMFDLNNIASELIFFSIQELGYFELPAQFLTGISIMRQQTNTEVLDLLRAT